jgi:hypothetical protein
MTITYVDFQYCINAERRRGKAAVGSAASRYESNALRTGRHLRDDLRRLAKWRCPGFASIVIC